MKAAVEPDMELWEDDINRLCDGGHAIDRLHTRHSLLIDHQPPASPFRPELNSNWQRQLTAFREQALTRARNTKAAIQSELKVRNA